MGWWTTRGGVKRAIRERDIQYLEDAVRNPETPQQARDSVADFVAAFLRGNAKFPHR